MIEYSHPHRRLGQNSVSLMTEGVEHLECNVTPPGVNILLIKFEVTQSGLLVLRPSKTELPAGIPGTSAHF